MAPLLTELSNGKHLVFNGVPIYKNMERAKNERLPDGVDHWHFSANYNNKKIFFNRVFSLICLTNFYSNVMVDDKIWENLRKDKKVAELRAYSKHKDTVDAASVPEQEKPRNHRRKYSNP